MLMADAYSQKGDYEKTIVFGERALEADPKNFATMTLLASTIASKTRENDLDKEEKLTRADKLLNGTLETIKTTPKPNPGLTDQQWEEAKKFMSAEAHNDLGLIAITRKKYDVAISEFKTAADTDPQPAYMVRLASAYESTGKHAEAIAICDKVLADPQLHPQIKQVATNIKNAATAAKK